MHGFVLYRRFGRARSLRNDQAVCVLGRYVALARGRPLRSDQTLARTQSLRSDRAVCVLVLGRYVATEFWLEIATEPCACSVAT
ncbi:hypothetical protein F2Q69_00055748 [Brassica cretica]|uniref:Uncharacterized protein n=1 Tax=Brassica cretica TaxID=69181 RepID=A0A8S9N260_BRACR|nr:hypothetical protein F2Q69_00055748 [Brassica cretica]